MKILYLGVHYEHYNPNQRYSFEYHNFFETFQGMPGVTVIEHSFDRILEVGKRRYNEEIMEIVMREEPDLLFVFTYTDEIDPEVLDRVRKETRTKSMAWFADDYWRFFNYSKNWAPHFDFVVTTYSRAVEWYRAAGFNNVILSQWGCNTRTYKPIDVFKDIDVSFVGQRKSGRVKVIDGLRRANIPVEAYGSGWPNGKISQQEMLEIFSRSKICLNLTDRKSLLDPSVAARVFFKKSIARVRLDRHLIDNFRAWIHFPIIHTHARPFELAGCGAFVISGWSEDIEQYYIADKEMVFYRTTAELAEKAAYYLSHDEEREAIARAGYERTMKEHTYEARFEKIFQEAGLTSAVPIPKP